MYFWVYSRKEKKKRKEKTTQTEKTTHRPTILQLVAPPTSPLAICAANSPYSGLPNSTQDIQSKQISPRPACLPLRCRSPASMPPLLTTICSASAPTQSLTVAASSLSYVVLVSNFLLHQIPVIVVAAIPAHLQEAFLWPLTANPRPAAFSYDVYISIRISVHCRSIHCRSVHLRQAIVPAVYGVRHYPLKPHQYELTIQFGSHCTGSDLSSAAH